MTRRTARDAANEAWERLPAERKLEWLVYDRWAAERGLAGARLTPEQQREWLAYFSEVKAGIAKLEEETGRTLPGNWRLNGVPGV